MNILVICDRDWTHPQAGGAGLNLGSQVERWLEAGDRVRVLTAGYPGSASRERLGRLEIVRRGGAFTVFPWTWWEILRGAARDVDVVLEIVNGIPWFSRYVTHKPTVAMIHHVCKEQFDREIEEPYKTVGKFLESSAMPFFYRNTPFVTVSEASRNDLTELGIPAAHIAVIHNGLDLELHHPTKGETDDPTLVFLGRLKAYKRIDLLFELFARINAKVPDSRLVLIGDGDHRPHLENLAGQMGLGDQIEFRGFLSERDKVDALSSSWVAVTASDVEGWGLSIMEAAACGTPAVAFDLSGLSESVIDGVTGYLVANGDEFVSRVVELTENADLRAEMGKRAIEWAANFDWDLPARLTHDVLEAAGEGLDPAACALSASVPEFGHPVPRSGSTANTSGWPGKA